MTFIVYCNVSMYKSVVENKLISMFVNLMVVSYLVI